MKTDDLIRALAADAKPAGPKPAFALALAVACGFAVSAVLFAAWVGLRPHLGSAMLSPLGR